MFMLLLARLHKYFLKSFVAKVSMIWCFNLFEKIASAIFDMFEIQEVLWFQV